MLITHGTSSKKYSQPHKPAKPHLCQSLMPPKKPSVHNLANPSSGHPQFSTMIHYGHACCEQHRCLGYSSSTQQGASHMRQFFFLSTPPPPGDGGPTFLLTRVQKWKKCVMWWCCLCKDSLSPPTRLDNEAW